MSTTCYQCHKEAETVCQRCLVPLCVECLREHEEAWLAKEQGGGAFEIEVTPNELGGYKPCEG